MKMKLLLTLLTLGASTANAWTPPPFAVNTKAPSSINSADSFAVSGIVTYTNSSKPAKGLYFRIWTKNSNTSYYTYSNIAAQVSYINPSSVSSGGTFTKEIKINGTWKRYSIDTAYSLTDGDYISQACGHDGQVESCGDWRPFTISTEQDNNSNPIIVIK